MTRPGVAAPVTAVAATIPAVRDLLGYQFEVAPMVMAVSACIVVRIYKGARAKSNEGWVADLSITFLTLLFTVAIVITWHPSLVTALMFGTGTGALGAGLIRIAEKKAKPFFDETPDDAVDGEEATRRAIERVTSVKRIGE